MIRELKLRDKIYNLTDVGKIKSGEFKDMYSAKYVSTNASKPSEFSKLIFFSKSKDFKTVHGLAIESGIKNRKPIVLNSKKPANFRKLITLINSIKGNSVKEIIQNVKEKFNGSAKMESYDISLGGGKLQKIYMATGLMSGVITMIVLIIFWGFKLVRVSKASYNEKYASTTAELELDKILFNNQKGNESEFDAYSGLTALIQNVIKNKESKGALIYGPPGTGKTYVIRRELHFMKLKPGVDYTILKGGAKNVYSVYAAMYRFKNKLIILDDFDVDEDHGKDVINLLKSATDSYPIRIISFQSTSDEQSQDNMGQEIPSKFEFKGKILIITNKSKGEIDSALLSRLPSINVEFDLNSTLDLIKKMVKYTNPFQPMKQKQEVVEFIVKNKNKIGSKLSMRLFKNILDVRYSMSDWEAVAYSIIDG